METTVEPSQNTANSSQTYQPATLNDAQADVKPSRSWLFTSEKAREANRKSVEARRKQGIAAAEAIEIVDKLKLAQIVQPILEPEDTYRLNRLKATREALDGLYSDLNAADDAKDQKAICDSIARLSEVERLLAGRPAPGSRRPAQDKPKRATPDNYGPVE